MTNISKDAKLATFINVFTVEPTNQQRLVELLARVTDTSVRHAPDFISSAVHRSLDGRGPSLVGSVIVTARGRPPSRTMLRLPASRSQGYLEVLRNVTDDIHEGA